MPEACAVVGSVAAGLLVAFSLVSVPAFKRRDTPGAWSGAPLARVRALIEHRDWESRLALAMERAGWRWSPRRAALTAGAIVCLLGAIGLVIGPAFVPFGLAAGLCVCMMALASTSERRRRRIQGELVPLLELFTLELSGGGSALSALGSVTVQIEVDHESLKKKMLIASQVSGSATFETRLNAYSERLRIPPLASLATILAASREFGTGTIQGVRALATDLRRGQRRELIERSRKALNRVLLPAAFGVLLPFLGILMFPAITVLERSLR